MSDNKKTKVHQIELIHLHFEVASGLEPLCPVLQTGD